MSDPSPAPGFTPGSGMPPKKALSPGPVTTTTQTTTQEQPTGDRLSGTRLSGDRLRRLVPRTLSAIVWVVVLVVGVVLMSVWMLLSSGEESDTAGGAGLPPQTATATSEPAPVAAQPVDPTAAVPVAPTDTAEPVAPLPVETVVEPLAAEVPAEVPAPTTGVQGYEVSPELCAALDGVKAANDAAMAASQENGVTVMSPELLAANDALAAVPSRYQPIYAAMAALLHAPDDGPGVTQDELDARTDATDAMTIDTAACS